MKNYKRQYRQLSDEVKNRIRTSTKNKPKSEEHKRRIQQSMLRYWQTVPNKPESLTMDLRVLRLKEIWKLLSHWNSPVNG